MAVGMAVGQGGIYRFGEFQLDRSARQLWRGDERIAVEARALDLLLYLVEQRGRTLSRLELTRALWGEVEVSDGSLRRTVSLLRKALDARGPDGTTVETVHGRGYRFAARVDCLGDESPALQRDMIRAPAPSEGRSTARGISGFEAAAASAP